MKSSEYKKEWLLDKAVDVLACKILIWEPEDKNKIDANDPADDKCLVLRECQSIEIEESYKKLIGTASVKFPRGTIIKRTTTKNDIEENGTKTVYTERLADGTITEKRAGYSTAQPSDFKVGQRIRIYLGYYRDTGKVFKDAKERQDAMDAAATAHKPMFDGYIVKCSVSTPIEIKCENLASNLKRKNCRKIITGKDARVNDFLKEGGKYDLLKGTGLKLHPDTVECDINIGKVQLSEDLTIADLLTEWSKYKLYCFVRTENGVPYIKVGRSYFSAKTKESILNNDQSVRGTPIQFDYHVAEDGLTLMNTDPRFLAVSAEGFKYEPSSQGSTKEVKYSITIRLNPEWEGTHDTKHKKFQLLNETKLSKKSLKLGAVPKSQTKDKVDLSQYTIIPYTSNHIGITEDQLIKEAEAYFDGYNMNGIEGTITVFGDHNFESGMKVELLDIRQPEKNGWYLIEEVNTKFGVNGYRQTLKLPYCIARPEKEK
jgi:hypothetical protein